MPDPRASSPASTDDVSPSASHLSEDDTDVELMQRVAKQDEAAFEQLIERHQHAVIGTVAKMLGNPSDAEDIAQQVFIRIWKSAPRYKPTAKFTTFLFTIARNLVFNESRRRSRKKEYSMDEREDDFHLQTPDPQQARPDQDVLHAELQHAVDQAIASLPEKQRMAVILRRYEGMPYDEISEVLGLSISAVKSQLFRARTTLRETLQQYLNQ
ncbi:sigma-70 family RNA polymerase sigma factor [Verrucomicrobiaceae bacterium N1E253]|uniref:RNA polymerase sigma factor n=2 Tax=Oceaniferula marina TaxID=2748318 RepID=A0A851GHA2_9BACT|nr:sigma-70 family RNA polymerase sigma factor [Oceaniferula marina]